MKRLHFFIAFMLSLAMAVHPAFSAESSSVGIVQELLGTVSVLRNGEPLGSFDIGDSVENFDLIKTGKDGSLVVALVRGTGMAGTLIVKPNSVFTVKTAVLDGTPSTEGELLGGSVGFKLRKISGDPQWQVRSGGTVMGIRGTDFDVSVSVNDSLLVACSDGRVECAGEDGDTQEAVPGQAVEGKAGERLRRVGVAVSSLKDFQDRWYAEEISAFRASPVQVLDQYARTYLRYRDSFRSAHAKLAASPVFTEWKYEFGRGVRPSANNVQTMKQKSALVPTLMAIRRVLFLFERVYYRLDEVQSYLDAGALSARLSSGMTVRDFLRAFGTEKTELERKTAEYRFALRLFADRNDGQDPFSLGSDEDDFFD